MKPNMIEGVLDLAFRARANGDIFNPLFVGAPGLGKSQIVQAYCKARNIPFIDFRAAYMEAPDLIGFPSVETKNGRQITVHNIPEMWPHEDEAPSGILLLEEPNRGTTSVMNTFMQLLTDRKVHKYELPEGWIIVGCINPENEENDVNAMDAALKDRFETYTVEFEKSSFVTFMRAKNWDPTIINFVDTNTWKYTLPEDTAKNDGSKYISPRTLSKLNTALRAGLCDFKDLERTTYDSILGRNVGAAFHNFKNNEQPVTFSELKNPNTQDASLRKIKTFCDPKNYKSGTIAITIRDIVESAENGNVITDKLLAKVVLALTADQGPVLISELSRVLKDDSLLSRICSDFPDVKKYLKSVLRQG